MTRTHSILTLILLCAVSASAQDSPTWTRFGALYHGRLAFEAADIGDGRILVVGGSPGIPSQSEMNAEPLASTEIIDVWRREIYEASPLNIGRSEFALVTMPDTSVVVLGGVSGRDPRGELTTSVERYDRATGRWRIVGNLLVGRRQHAAAWLDDRFILVAGGREQNYGTHRSAEIFDLVTGRSVLVDPLPFAMNYPVLIRSAATGRVLLFGGRTGGANSERSGAVHAFDEVHNAWVAHSSMTMPLWLRSGALRLWDGRVMVAGGTITDLPGLYSTDVQIERAPKWQRLEPLAIERGGSRMAQWSERRVLVMGGIRNDGTNTETTEWVDLETGAVTPGPSMRYARDRFFAMSVPARQGDPANRRAIVAISGQPSPTSLTPAVDILDPGPLGVESESASAGGAAITTSVDDVEARLKLRLPVDAKVDLTVHAVDGRVVAMPIASQWLDRGTRSVSIDVTGWPAGWYGIVARIGAERITVPLLLPR